MDLWGTAAIGIAALLLAANQGVKDAPRLRALLPQFSLPGWASYVPLALFVAGVGLHFAAPKAKMLPSANSSNRESPKALANKGPSVVEGVDPKKIWELRKGRSSYEYQLLKKPYDGAPAVITGVMSDLSQDQSGTFGVSLEEDGSGFGLELEFVKEASPELQRLRPGDRIKAQCNFKGVGSILAFFDNCKLAPHS